MSPKKIIKSFLFTLIIFISSLMLIGCDDTINPLDEINYYEITINPRQDGTLDMNFNIEWKVLNDSTEGPLEWIKIGIPNVYADELRALSSTISKISYMDESGAYVRLDLNRKYYKNEIVKMKFSIHQKRMYTFDEEYCYYNYQPGWFDEIKVKKAKVIWNADGVLSSNTNNIKNHTYIWETSLNYGETMKIEVKYPVSYFKDLKSTMQYTDRSLTNESIIIAVCFFLLISIAVVTIIISNIRKCDPYMDSRGFCGNTHIYPGYHFYIFNRGVDNKGNKRYGTSSSYVGRSSGGSSCACACACACAGGGRAGCSKKDFYKAKIDVEKVLAHTIK